MKLLFCATFMVLFNFIVCFPLGHLVSSETIKTPLSNLDDAVTGSIKSLVNSKAINIVPPFPDSGRTQAVLEQETSLVGKLDTKYSNLQQFVAGFYNPKPIIDTIREEDKYGNDGDKFRGLATAVVGGYEGLSNFLNAAINVPFELTKQTGRKITATLNMVGGKLVGLAK